MKIQGIIRLIRTSEADTQDDRNDGKVWQRIRRWRRGAAETVASEM